MSQFFQIHPVDPQPRLIRQAVELLRQGAVIVYPTDSAYALGCHLEDKKAMDRIRRIRQVDDKHNFTLVCGELSQISTYAKLTNNTLFRILNSYTPGPYTFILNATSEVPRRLLHPKRRTIGIRIPDNAIAQALVAELGEPIMSSTLILPDQTLPLTDPEDIREQLEHQVDLVIDGGHCGFEPSTVVDMTDEVPKVVRRGKGESAPFETD
ncbi:L-threonylcarbamoyladenylate synthase [Thiohalophilus thiocyanatoxydans]|uniref:tRNA threonylcarbamoyl adenosine modification protein (Sua5/YciO/YrdC/YwlC family) n=1 Tax=Thiohalophilus thiocyanatoxydans TaxID=381308 RepID=A0A4R8IXV3_9GAMM|nr:L-threonylcarbamoyladenylate synthase [Thiohalophilus thiocyanatoxydans]TDY02629.1 tRNA threonylcarbamoyl adenosine modification protein (Sua5/YciO/YrdC/YwlC family) [Thiohalophilus thiocyanatoxydans]